MRYFEKQALTGLSENFIRKAISSRNKKITYLFLKEEKTNPAGFIRQYLDKPGPATSALEKKTVNQVKQLSAMHENGTSLIDHIMDSKNKTRAISSMLRDEFVIQRPHY